MNRVLKKIKVRFIGAPSVISVLGEPVKRFYRLRTARSVVMENERLQDEIKRISKNSYDMVSNVSHELKTPLATIKEALLLLSEGSLGAVNEKQKKFLDISNQNVERLNRLINEFLSPTKLKDPNLSMKRSLFSITDTAKTIINSLDIIAKEKGIVLEGIIPDKKDRDMGGS